VIVFRVLFAPRNLIHDGHLWHWLLLETLVSDKFKVHYEKTIACFGFVISHGSINYTYLRDQFSSELPSFWWDFRMVEVTVCGPTRIGRRYCAAAAVASTVKPKQIHAHAAVWSGQQAVNEHSGTVWLVRASQVGLPPVNLFYFLGSPLGIRYVGLSARLPPSSSSCARHKALYLT